MKRFFLFVALATFLSPASTFAEGWGTQEFNPTRQINAGFLCGVTCPIADQEKVGYMIGDGGTVYKTTDNGQSWFGATGQYTNGAYIGTDKSLYGVTVQQTGTVTVVGQDGLIGWSENGGLNWSFFSSPTTEDLHAVTQVDYQHSFAVGDNGTIVGVLGNYGTAWTKITSPTTSNLNALAYTSDAGLVAVGDDGALVISNDRGTTWESHRVWSGTTDLIAVDIVDGDTLFIASRSQIYKSTDGGDNWDSIGALPSGTTLQDIDFATEDVGVATFLPSSANADEAIAYTYLTEDGGHIWESLPVYATDSSPLKINDVHFDDLDTIPGGSSYTPSLYGFGYSDYHNATTYGGFYRYTFDSAALVKLPCTDDDTDTNAPCKAVYYVGRDGERHAFSSASVFFSWYDDFNDVITVDADYLASLSLGDAVTYRPGEQLVKFPSSPKVYAVSQNGVLREIRSESIAKSLYGSHWANEVKDINEAFFGHYTIGEDITSADDYDVSQEKADASDIHEERGW